MTDLNLSTDPQSDAPASPEAFDDAWEFARNEVPDVTRADIGPDEYLLAWITDDAGNRYASGVPAELLDGTYRHVLVPPDPVCLYVHDDPAGWQDRNAYYCMKSGIAVLYGGGNGNHYPSPCYSFAHEACGPRRCRSIYNRMQVEWEGHQTVFMARFDAPTLNELRARIGTRNTPRGKASTRAGKDGGKAITIITGVDGDYHAFIFSTVDFSARAWKDYPACQCDAMPLAHGLAYLDMLLRSGIILRRTSRAVKLRDRGPAGTGSGGGICVGNLTPREWNLLLPTVEQIFIAEGGKFGAYDTWPEWSPDEWKRRSKQALDLVRSKGDAAAPSWEP